ncbi:MAG: aminopeptidase [Actinomycetota bacterium]|nr:aminopeptidase [Actinomycetota bacterium]
MNDPRFERLAELIADYSLELRERQIVRLDGGTVAEPLLVALHRAAIRRGAHPYAHVEVEGLRELLASDGSDEQIDYVSPIDRREIEGLDAQVTVWSDANTRSFSRIDPGRHQRLLGAERVLRNRRWERISRGELRWCGTLSPGEAHAQEAELSLREYEDFVFRACHVLDEDPVAHWRGISERLNERTHELSSVRELRIVGPDTDLTLGVEGRRWAAADGRLNMPDGEVYTSPVEDATEGTVRFGFPAVFEGREIEDVRLRFEGGRVVEHEARVGADYFAALLAMDDGARVLGEAAFGLNYEIDRFTRNILFDEKIGGTMHLALGFGFEELGGINRSRLHLDLICDLREEGEVYADGELIWRAGRFLAEPAVAVGRV